jgi:CDP-diacylglycerol--glycerol-3-phosphate 3-phosphatidyltransferase
VKALPWVLIGLRLLFAPVIIVAALMGWRGSTLFAIAALAMLADLFDGVIARKLRLDTERIRQVDSRVDTVFYFGAGIALLYRFPSVWHHYEGWIVALAIVELGRMVFEWRKFGRAAAYHMWSAKAWGLAMLLGFGEVTLKGHAGVLFILALAVGFLTNLEGLAASILFRQWHYDVATFWHALRIERQLRSAQG